MNRDPRKHLTNKEFVDFVLDGLPECEEAEVQLHIDHCRPCANKVEEFYATADRFPEREWDESRRDFICKLREQLPCPRSRPNRKRNTP
jgi:hypothetical protein